MSGAQYQLQFKDYSAVVTGVGGGLRSLAYAGRDLVRTFAADSVRPAFRGAVLAPWPNRVVDGQYYFDGQPHSLASTEPDRGHALHGLAAWAVWEPVAVEPDRVSLTHTISAQPGYPFRIELTVTYALTAGGMNWELHAVNTGLGRAPFGAAPHPYLIAGEGTVDDWTLTVPATHILHVSAGRLIPIELREVSDYDGGSLDFRTGRPVGDTFIDHAFTGIDWSADDSACVDLLSPSGSGVRMAWDRKSPWVQIHTPQAPGPDSWRNSLAVEPMTCPPDAFNSHTDLVVLSPGDRHTVGWQISAL